MFLSCWLLLLFFLTGGFYVSGLLFHAISTPPQLLRPVKASTGSELYPDFFRLLYFCQVFPSQFYRERYGFHWAFFTHRRFLPYAPSPTALARFVTQMRTGTPHPGSFSVPALTELSLPVGTWASTTHIVVTRSLIYQLCQWATKYNVKTELLKMFCLFKVIWKGYKNTLNKTWCTA